MSEKGQDNQRGISFQNKVALLYMLDHYRYANFTEIRFEGDNFEDFTLFFTDTINHSTFVHNFEVKNWQTPLKRSNVRKILKKEIQKGANRYSENGKFFIVAPAFTEDCKEIEAFKSNYFFNSSEDFEKTKKIYRQVCEDSPLFSWSKEEILFLKYVHLVELKLKNIDNMIIDRFLYEDSFFYSEDNLENIINRFLKKIIDKSSNGRSLSKNDIHSILSEFHRQETQKSESYHLDRDLGQIIENIEDKIKTESQFKTLDHSRYITPISSRPKAIFYIVDKLKQKKFKLQNIKWFIDKVLIKKYYFFQCLNLLEMYLKENDLTKENIGFILKFIFKVYKKDSCGSDFQNFSFDSYRIFKLLLQICNKHKISGQFKAKTINFLNNSVPDWEREHKSHIGDSYNYQHIPKLIENLLGHSEKGLEMIFKKHKFARYEELTQYNRPYYNYIKNFINKDFKKHFPLVIKNLRDQFQRSYISYGCDYEGYEIHGGGYSGVGNNYIRLHVLPLESVLSQCIRTFYEETKNWEYLTLFINSEFDKDNPIFVKRSFIPFLLKELEKTSDENLKDNKFYKALETILKIKKGFPRTESILTKELHHAHSKIKDHYLDKLMNMILYKYSKEGISYDILTVQLLFRLIEDGKLKFKNSLKKILLNENFKNDSMYDRALGLFEGTITNQNINQFFNEIKDELDISQNDDLIYRYVISDLKTSSLEKSKLSKLFKSSSKKDLNSLASIIEKDLWNTSGSKFLEKVLELMKNHLDLNDFYKRTKKSEYLKRTIVQLIERAINYDMNLSEKIIDLCIKDNNPCGENENLHNEVAKGGTNLSTSTMRACLCLTINSYICNYNQKTDRKSLEKLEKAFSWVKLLIDLDGLLASEIKGSPSPNYYLRTFAIMPLIGLAHHEIRSRLNDFKIGLGDKIKNLAFSIIEKTKEEVEKNKYTPIELFNRISSLFDYIRDLNEEEARKFLFFIEFFRIPDANHFFIYYALFRERHFKEKRVFKSDIFKEKLENICKGEPDKLKRSLSFNIYKNIENKNQEDELQPDFDFFEKIKDYWILLFEDVNKDMFFSLLMTLSLLLKEKRYYRNYKKYFFQLIKKILDEDSDDYFIHLNNILPAISENNPDDLTETLLLFLDKGDSKKGHIPFNHEVEQRLIPEIKKVKNKISSEKLSEIDKRLKKYGLSLAPKKASP